VTYMSTLPRGTQCVSETTPMLKVRNGEHKSQKGIKKSPLVKHFNEMKLPITSLQFIGIDYVPKAPRRGRVRSSLLRE